jgi:hypothetical protein
MLPFVPEVTAFFDCTADVYTYTGGAFPPPAGNKRLSAIAARITNTFGEGSRTRSQATENFTHLLLVDPSLEIRDGYLGNNTAEQATLDMLAIPAGQTNNWYAAIFSFVCIVPTLGKRKVIVLDRHSVPGDWVNLL